MSYKIQSCNMSAIGYEGNRRQKSSFLRDVSSFMATYHAKNWVLVTASWISYWRFGFLVVASNFVKWIQNSCHWVKFHTLFLSFWRIEFRSVDLYLHLSLYWNFCYGSDNFCFSNLKLSFLFVFLVFSFLIVAFLDN